MSSSSSNGEKMMISLEQYLNFIDSCKQFNLTVPQLRQIIGMHGFRKNCSTPKKVMLEMVNSIDLMEPSRSTLEDADNVFPSAAITVDQAIKDLVDLNWQECCVTSLLSFSSTTKASYTSRGTSKPKSRKRPQSFVDVERESAAIVSYAGGCGESVCSLPPVQSAARSAGGSGGGGSDCSGRYSGSLALVVSPVSIA